MLGCAGISAGQATVDSQKQFIGYHRKQAQLYINQGLYKKALTHIEILSTIAPYNTNYKKNLTDLHKLIKHNKTSVLKASKVAANSGQEQQAYRLLLKALSLTPEDKSIVSELRKYHRKQMKEEQIRKQAKYANFYNKKKSKAKKAKSPSNKMISNTPTTEEGRDAPVVFVEENVKPNPSKPYQELYERKKFDHMIAKAESSTNQSFPSNVENMLVRAYMEVATKLQKQQKWIDALGKIDKASQLQSASTSLKKDLNVFRGKEARVLLEKGKALLRKDLNEAIALIEMAKKYDPINSSVALELKKALQDER